MITKADGPDEILPLDAARDPALAAWYRLMRLKRLYRQGWLRIGIPESEAESVADHSFGSAILALLLAASEPGLDAGHAALLALAHELGESFAGDITPAHGIDAGRKRQLEAEAVERALAGCEDAGLLRGLWEEYEAGKSEEARFVREVDRLEMGLQAALHAAEGRQGMGEFLESASQVVKRPRLRSMLDEAAVLAGVPAPVPGREAGKPDLPGRGDA